ncbi:hypothetical protein [Hyalangium versicolor]|uniref:hypothetical protein n=1 Tax=Hyalangium versicolor TaxID=2861190 RepID=UPI001CCE72CD|nr:hypothetical protein [Hyalangium versicolor]
MSSSNTSITNPYKGLNREQVLATMMELLKDETRNHLRMGLLYIYVVDSSLLEGTPYKNAVDFICGNIQEVSRTALVLYGAVARAFNEAVCTQFGMTRLQLLLTYKKVAKIEVNSDTPGDTPILVPDSNGQTTPKPFSACSVDELRKALAHQRSTTPSQPIPEADRALYDGYLQAIMSRFPKGSSVRVQMRTHEGKTLIDFQGIPLAEVPTLSEALISQL